MPKAIREAAYGLGATRWEVTKDHVLPYSTGGILTGLILGLSRAIGETAPIITIGALSFIAFLPDSPISGEFPFVNLAWLKSEFTAMPIQIFNWVSRPDQAFQQNAAAAAAILLGDDACNERHRDLDSLSLPQEDQLVSGPRMNTNLVRQGRHPTLSIVMEERKVSRLPVRPRPSPRSWTSGTARTRR